MGRRSGGLGSWVGIGKMSLTLLAVTAMMALLASCGDTVYEAKGGSGGAAGTATGTINISVKDGAGQTSFTKKSDSVTVTLLNDPRNQGFPTSVLVDNGGVTFNGLAAGIYKVRVSKPGYASSFSGNLELKNEQDYNERNQDYFILRTISETVDLFPLTAGLKGTLKYAKPGSAADGGVAAGATVQIVINDERLADNREQQVTTGTDGSFTFSELPATNNTNYSIVALSRTFGEVVFADAPVSNNSLALRPNVTQTLLTQTVYNSAVTALAISTSTVSVSKDAEIEVTFSEELDVDNLGGSNVGSVMVGATLNPSTGAYTGGTEAAVELPVWSGSKVTIKPKTAWKDVAGGNVTVTFSNVRSKQGKVLGAATVEIAVLDGSFGPFSILKNRGSVNDEGNVILVDAASPIVLIFSKDLDESRIQGDGFALLKAPETHSTVISGSTLTLAPIGKEWKNVSALEFAGIDLTTTPPNKTGALALLKSVDGDAFTDGAPSIQLIKPIIDPIGPVSTADTTLAVTDDLYKLVIELSEDIDVAKSSEARVYVAYGETDPLATALPADILAAGKAGDAVRYTVSGAKITLAPEIKWVGNTGDAYNVVAVTGVVGKSGQKADDFYVVVKREAGATLSLFPTVASGDDLDVGDEQGSIRLRFDDALDSRVSLTNFVSLPNNEPFVLEFEEGDSVLVISPLPGFAWITKTNFTVTLKTGLPSKSGKQLTASKTIPITWGSTGTGDTFDGTQTVAWLKVDDSLTVQGVMPEAGQPIRLIWKPVKDATKYLIHYYEGPGKSANLVNTFFTTAVANPNGTPAVTGAFWSFADVGAVAIGAALPDSVGIVTAVVNTASADNDYTFVVTPVAADNSLGGATTINVKTRPRITTTGHIDGVWEIATSTANSFAAELADLLRTRNNQQNSVAWTFTTSEPLDLTVKPVVNVVVKGVDNSVDVTGFPSSNNTDVRGRVNGDAIDVRAGGSTNEYVLRVTPRSVSAGTTTPGIPAGCVVGATGTQVECTTAPTTTGAGKGVVDLTNQGGDVSITFSVSGLVGASGGSIFVKTVDGSGTTLPEYIDGFTVSVEDK